MCAHQPSLISDKPLKLSEPQCFHFQNGNGVTPSPTLAVEELGILHITAGGNSWNAVTVEYIHI